MVASGRAPTGQPRRPARFYALLILFVALCAGFTALAAWQVERRAWKHALIERVERRIHAPAADAPGRDHWPRVTAADDAYRRVVVRGAFVPDAATFVRAVTALGSGSWMLVPLRRDDGTVVLVNRGFVPDGQQASVARVAGAGPGAVTGLLRLSEPGGGFLQHNDPAADRWFSRDVAAIAARRRLSDVAPYFIDAEADADGIAADLAHGGPVGGLTVVSFSDNHLLYATVWGCLAVLAAAAVVVLVRPASRTIRD